MSIFKLAKLFEGKLPESEKPKTKLRETQPYWWCPYRNHRIPKQICIKLLLVTKECGGCDEGEKNIQNVQL